MKAVVSQTWLISGEHAARYAEINEEFEPWMASRPGYRGRTLVQGHDDPCYILHVRYFDRIEDYLDLLREEAYQQHLDQLIELVDPGRYPPNVVKREFGDVIHHVAAIDDVDEPEAPDPS